uniref:AGBL carboxypeptidase 2 n=1 Tax=Xiphophorus couchianus TaxID=32473 RepID=A0A3B5L4Q1_9TELE
FLDTPPDITLEFESRFESGNLQKAVQVGAFDYELTLRTDMYTEKHTQWFYFRLRNMKAKMIYRFTITNLMKASSLYSLGMRPLLYSERAAKENGVGWHRAGSNIRYYQNCSEVASGSAFRPLHVYTCYLAHCYPYTYSRLQYYLKQITSNPAVASYCEVRTLCQSLGLVNELCSHLACFFNCFLSTSGSNSSDSDGLPVHLLHQQRIPEVS